MSKDEFLKKCKDKKFSIVEPQSIRLRFIKYMEKKNNIGGGNRGSINFSTLNYNE